MIWVLIGDGEFLGLRYASAYLSSLIINTIDGNRATLSDFIADCTNAFELANFDQKRALLTITLPKICQS